MKKHLFFFLTVFLFFAVTSASAQTIHYVKAGGSGDGTSWANASGDLQAMINSAGVEQVWVAKGTYQPAVNGSFVMKNDVAIYGGFDDTGNPGMADRNWKTYATILQGNGNSVIKNTFSGNPLLASAVLDGFTITGGNSYSGGGIYNYEASPTLTNLNITGNSVNTDGGGIYNYHSTPRLTYVILSGNYASYDGGGIFNYGHSPSILTNVILKGNTAGDNGGGMFNSSSAPTLTNVSVIGNTANQGGGLANIYLSNASLTNSIVWDNTANSVNGVFNEGGGSSSTIISYSLVQDIDNTGNNGLDGTDPGNDPQFTNATNGDYSLQATSPAINAGSNQAYTNAGGDLQNDVDLAGNPRLYEGTIDMGAYESQGLQISPDGNNIVYVDINVSGGDGSGDSWANAVPELADALKYAQLQNAITPYTSVNPLKIFVAGGTYKPLYSPADNNFGNDAGRDNSFLMVKNVQLYGGFAGTEASLAERDLSIIGNETILSGDINGDDVISGSGSTLSITNNNENNYRVLVSFGAVDAACLDGFAVTGGNANGTVKLTINTLQMVDAESGGGMYNLTSSPNIVNVSFNGNSATYGAGMQNDNSSSPILTNVTLSGNTADLGGGMYNYSSSPILTNVTLSGNTADLGGGMFNNQSSSPSMVNVTLSGNSATNFGGGMFNNQSSSPNLTNSILWGNTATNSGGIYNDNSTPVISYSLVQDIDNTGSNGLDGTDTNNDPQFTDPVNGDYSLQSTSPVINLGSNQAYTDAGGDLQNDVDLAGNPRLFGLSIDMGAFESQVNPPAYTTLVSLGSGILTIQDLVDKDDDLTISYTGGNFIITDINGGIINTNVAGATGDGTASVTIPNIGVNSILAKTLGGDDTFTVDFSGGNFNVPIDYEGGIQTGGDILALAGGGTFDNVTHNFTNKNDGSVSVSGNGLISYTGLEPIIDNLNVNDRVFNYTGGAETITLNAGGSLDNQIVSTLGESVDFNNPNTSLTINTEVDGGSGADVVNIEGVSAGFDADLTVNGGSDDNINFQTNPTNIGNGSFDINGKTISVVQNLTTASTGAITLSASRNIVVNSAAMVSSADGNITFHANAWARLTGVDVIAIGIYNDSKITTSGSGNIEMTGVGVGSGASSFNFGVQIESGTIENTGSGSISVMGIGGDGFQANQGVRIGGATTGITTIDGGITINGIAGNGTGDENDGVTIIYGALIEATGTAAISIAGNSGTGTDYNRGVNLFEGKISSAGGGVFIYGGSAGANDSNVGISMVAASFIKDSNGGNILLTGTGGNGVNSNIGVNIIGSVVESNNGNIVLIGTGGQGSGNDNLGVDIVSSAQVRDIGTGGVTIVGDGGTGVQANLGVQINGPASVTSNGGDISISGIADPATTGIYNIGTIIRYTATVSTTGSGAISIDGTSGGGVGSNYGLEISSDGTVVSTENGDIALNGSVPSSSQGANNLGVYFNNALINSTGTGSIQIIGTSASADSPAINIESLGTPITAGGAITATANVGKLKTPAGIPAYSIFDATTTAVNGILAPGQSPGQLAINGNFAIGSGDALEIEINGFTTAGTDYDQLVVNGTVDITDATLTLVDNFAGSLPEGHIFTIINNTGTGAVVGTFNGLPEGTAMSFNGQGLVISYNGGDGNDVVLTVSSMAITNPFITTWETTSANESITIPIASALSYDYTVDWGDGNISQNQTDNATHIYSTAGIHTVKIIGTFPMIYFNNSGDKDKIMTIQQWGDIQWDYMIESYYGCSNLTLTATDAPDLSNVQYMDEMFKNATSFNGDVSGWDVQNVLSMNQTFRGATSFNGDVSGWDVQNVTDFSFMFFDATSFNGDISGWDVESGEQMWAMFGNATSFNGDISGWDVHNVTTFAFMFYGATAFNGDISGWDVQNAQYTIAMFRGATAFNGDISGWNVQNVQSMNSMFFDAAAFSGDISGWDVQKVEDMNYMFSLAAAFDGDISGWNVQSVQSMYSMFNRATAFNSDISGWNVQNVQVMDSMFYGATAFDRSLGGWDIQSVTDMPHMFGNAGLSTANYDATLIGWNSQLLQNAVIFDGGNSTYSCAAADARDNLITAFGWTITDGGGLPGVSTQAVTNISSTAATANGNIICLGTTNPTAHGFCWNITGTPTTADDMVDKGEATATGAFTAIISPLLPNTIYYVRAFVTNAAGTSYGEEQSFSIGCINPTSGGTIAEDQLICVATAPDALSSSTLPDGFVGTLEYQWQVSSNGIDFTNIAIDGAFETYSPEALTANTWYRRLVKVECESTWMESNILEITVRPQFTPGAIATTGETISNGDDPSIIGSMTDASGGDGTITYQWESSTDDFATAGIVIPGAESASYDPPSGLTATTSYRRYAHDGTCNIAFEASTGTWKVIVYDDFTAGAIAASGETVCYGGDPVEIISVVDASGGDENITYAWYRSTNDFIDSSLIVDAISASYTPPSGLIETTSYRRYTHDGTSNPNFTVSVGTWKVIVYDDFTTGAIEIAGETISYGGDPGEIGSVTDAFGGDENITCQWESSTDDFTTAGIVIPGTESASYDPPSGLTATTSYRRYAHDGTCNIAFEASTGTWKVIVYDDFTAGAIAASGETVCYSGDPVEIISVVDASGGDENITYAWYRSTNDFIDSSLIVGATSASYHPSAGPTETTSYRRYAHDGTSNPNFTVSVGTWKVVVYDEFTPGAIETAGETISYGDDPIEIGSLADASGGDGTITYQWESSTDDFATPGSVISGAESASYDPPSGLTATTSYRRYAHDGTCNIAFEASTSTWKVIVYDEFTAGAIAASGETVCYGGDPVEIISVVDASGGDENITYAWYRSTNNFIDSSLIVGATSASYHPSAGPTETTSYRRYAHDGTSNPNFTVSVGTWKVIVYDEFAPGAIETTGETICFGGNPGEIVNITDASGGDKNITYQWESSTDDFATAGNVILGAESASYNPPFGLTETSSYRRYAKDGICNTDFEISTGTWKITIQELPVADAGSNSNIVEGETFAFTNAGAVNYSTLLWSSVGDGTFNGNALLNPVYTPGNGDIATGEVELCLTVVPESPCLISDTDCMTLTILRHPEVVIVSPADGSTVYDYALTVLGTASDADGDLAEIYIKLNEGAWELATGTDNWTFNFLLTGGYQKIEAKAVDAAGLESSITEINIFVGIQEIDLSQGWSAISSFLAPIEPALETVMSNTGFPDNLTIMMDNTGIYWPGYNINSIGNWDVLHGYKVKYNQADVLTVYGDKLQDQEVTFDAGLYFIPMLANDPVMISNIFTDPESDISYLFDITTGQVYWPQGSIYTIEELIPGRSYLTRFNQETTITFPDYQALKSAPIPSNPATQLEAPWQYVRTGEVHLISLFESALSGLENYAYIGAFDSDGLCIGCANIAGNGGNILLTVYGDDVYTTFKDGASAGEVITFRAYDPATGGETLLTATFSESFANTDGLFALGGLSAITGFKAGATGTNESGLNSYVRVYPNPAEDYIFILIPNHEGKVNYRITDLDGRLVAKDHFTGTEALLDVSMLNPGLYVITMEIDGQIVTRRIVVM
ncbi:MAG TPA: BspA family leucine-rich repeat surface protein [Bacteroidales bacterium]|nr:BspA family leucine-rich repeat surface protein [Bacteroidales bacterium]